jgi:hypothetical protein
MATQSSNDLLRIPSDHGSPVNEYRIHEGQVEFRSLDSHNMPFSKRGDGWRSLDVADIQLHFALKTAVAQWLVERLIYMREDDS